MTEEYTCIECENLYDDTDGDTDERMCNKCLDIIYNESLERKSEERVKSVMGKVDELIDWVKGERRESKYTQVIYETLSRLGYEEETIHSSTKPKK